MVQMAVVRDRAPVVLSPQCVGREFVRQYYTVLNQDPLKLHRFYTKHSRFLHGDSANGHSENPVMGQEAIYKKIQDLNFVDCRTKIRQVDSHSTLSEGVVVQVSGELSNNGQSMRRFMQTFVLAPGEDTRKYYVHNDIFRYQDEVFPEETSDETPDGTVDSEAEEESNNQVANGVTNYEQDSVHAQNAAQDVPSANLYYTDPVRNNSDSGSGLMQNQMMQEESQELQEIVVDKQLTEVTLNESAREMADMKGEEVQEPEASHLQQVSSDEAPSDIFRDTRDEEPVQESPKQEEKPKTWADMLGRSSGTPSMTVPPPKPQPKATPPRPAVVQPTVAKPTPPRDRPGFITKEARLAARNAPDDHQVFIGNLPNGVKDADVREVFSKYGAILEIRLNPKNFGFVIFNSADPVKQILLDKPIKIGTHEINIEEKKPSGARRDAPAAAGRGAAGGKGGGRGGGGGPGGRAAPGGTGAGGRGGGGGFGGNQRGVRRTSGSSARGGKFANK